MNVRHILKKLRARSTPQVKAVTGCSYADNIPQQKYGKKSFFFTTIFSFATLCSPLTMHSAFATFASQNTENSEAYTSSIVVDASNDTIISQKNADELRYPASLTKLMTLYITFRALREGAITLDQRVPVSEHASMMEPSKLGLMPYSHITVEQAILALVTKSANDAACALSELIGSGSESLFASMMTQQAHYMGMRNTEFRNASGLPDASQVTTARDLSILAEHLIKDFPQYYHYFSTPAFRYHGRYVMNHNPMLGVYSGADGLKTGYTEEAGRNLVTSALRDNVRLIGVVMGASNNEQRSVLMAKQLDQGFKVAGVAPVRDPILIAQKENARFPSRYRRRMLLASLMHHRYRGAIARVSHGTHSRIIGGRFQTVSTKLNRHRSYRLRHRI